MVRCGRTTPNHPIPLATPVEVHFGKVQCCRPSLKGFLISCWPCNGAVRGGLRWFNAVEPPGTKAQPPCTLGGGAVREGSVL